MKIELEVMRNPSENAEWQSKPGADQCSSHRRGADFPGGVHWCAALTKGADRAVVYSSSAIFEFFWGGVLENFGGVHTPLHPPRKSAPGQNP